MPLTHLKPNLLWQQFSAMNAIPRASKKEAALRNHYIAWATAHNFDYKTDAVGNIVIKKPATRGYEQAAKVILQGHLDMVCQKQPESTHDFDNDPIEMHIDSGFVKANGTTLGADNGIGVAAMLAILEDDQAQHGPLEVFLTVDEEAGMGGVRGLQPNWLEGEYLLNLDAEEWGTCYVGCAGGTDIILTKPLEFDARPQGHYYQLTLSGLKGGHSGLDIDSGRGNANQLLAEVLADFSMHFPIRLLSFKGGTLRNALTREAVARFALNDLQQEDIQQHVNAWQATLKKRLHGVDANVCLALMPLELAALDNPATITPQATHQVLSLLTLLPHGVIAQSHLVDAVETSCNIGVVSIDVQSDLQIDLLARSLNQEGINAVILRSKCLSQLADANCEIKNSYPGWDPNLQSKALIALLAVYKESYQKDMDIKVVHAGIETGLIAKSYPNLEMVSFGPTITGAHSPDEQVEIASVERFYELLKAVLARLK